MLGGARADWDQNTAEWTTNETKYHDRVCDPFPMGYCSHSVSSIAAVSGRFNEGLDDASRRFTQTGEQRRSGWHVVPVTCGDLRPGEIG